MQLRRLLAVGTGLLYFQSTRAALEVDLDDQASIKAAATQVAADLWTFYPQKPGWFIGLLDLPPPDGQIAWWVSGAFWGALIDYRQATGDTTYDDYIQASIVAQAGDGRDYLPSNWTSSIGNDDQSFWAFSAIMAAEAALPNPPTDQPQYLALAQAVFNEQTMPDRRSPNDTNCGGALRWQRNSISSGYTYVNTITNACYFNIGARLARYTQNHTYSELAQVIAEDIFRLGYVDSDFNVYDGAHIPQDCKDIVKTQYSYNAALMLQSCAFMYNLTTGDQVWKDRVDGLLNQTIAFFFPDGVAEERSCEPQKSCSNDDKTFKGYLHRWMASTGQLVPHTQSLIRATLKNSTAAAIKQCVGGSNGRMCGFSWASGTYDGTTGAINQMNVLGALTGLLALEPNATAPVTNTTGGTSIGDPSAGAQGSGTGGYDSSLGEPLPDITTADRIGAGVLTTFFLAGVMGVFAWMNMPSNFGTKVLPIISS